jgi:hypothetical protein
MSNFDEISEMRIFGDDFFTIKFLQLCIEDVEDNNSLQLFYRNICSKINSFDQSLRRSSQNGRGLSPKLVVQ